MPACTISQLQVPTYADSTAVPRSNDTAHACCPVTPRDRDSSAPTKAAATAGIVEHDAVDQRVPVDDRFYVFGEFCAPSLTCILRAVTLLAAR